MLTNVPTAESLDEVALRLHFDAWKRCILLLSDFGMTYGVDGDPSADDSGWADEWKDYVEFAQSEISAICTTIQQSAELRLKSIICETSPFLLLLNSNPQFKKKDVDFSELRTLDAVDLPNAVRTLTKFSLPPTYLEEYGKMRRMRNQVIHLGVHHKVITPLEVIHILLKQYASLWPDGRWLYRRTRFDGNSARNFFNDGRHLSTVSNVMGELSYTFDLMDNKTFKKFFGTPKGKLEGFCPDCMYARATKWDEDGHATAYRETKSVAQCVMCESEIELSTESKPCASCGGKISAQIGVDIPGSICFDCGH